MLDQIPDGFMMNAQGALIPEAKVKPQDKVEDQLVRDLMAVACDLSGQLAHFKEHAMQEAHAFKGLVAEEYGAKKGGAKGNMTLRTYDGAFEVELQISESQSFGPELQAAKELIDNCVSRWAEGTNDNIRVLVNHAFQVNKQGRIDTARVLGLRRLEIDDAEWQSAMAAISDAVKITGSKAYLRFYRKDEHGNRVPVSLNIAAL